MVTEELSPWWRKSVLLVLVVGFAILIWISISALLNAPPIPEQVTHPGGERIFTGEDILAGQQVFLKYGLMENGTIWGHGAYLGPDFSAEYLHALALDTGELIARENFNRGLKELNSDGANLLFLALVIVAIGSLLGEMLGVYQLLGNLWFWLGHQGWEYLDLGRGWQVLLAAGLVLWLSW